MKCIILPVKPRWAQKIYSGEKVLEIRKSYPQCQYPVPVYMAESGTGLVTGMFICPGVLHTANPETFTGPGCIGIEELLKYGPDKRGVYHGWAVEGATKFTVPYTIKQFGISRIPQSWRYTDGPASARPHDNNAKEK